MADPNVTSIVVDGVERWGAADAKWVQDAPKPAPAPVKEADAPEDAAPGKDPKPTRSRS
jgi:hypothetical protein